MTTGTTNWHFYEYPHKPDSTGTLKTSQVCFDGAGLVDALAEALGTRMVGKEWIPAKPGDVFDDLKGEHDNLYEQVPEKARIFTKTKYDLWHDMMRASGMIPPDEAGRKRLFPAHSFLIAVARLVSWTLAGARGVYESSLQEGFVGGRL